MALEMGKPVTSGRAGIEKCAWVCEYYAEHAETMLQPELIQTDARKSYVTYDPMGVIMNSILFFSVPMKSYMSALSQGGFSFPY